MTSVIVRKNEIDVVSRETYTAGSVNVYTVNAKLSNEWKALSATPVFRAGNVRISTVFDEYGSCIIPHEVLNHAEKMLEFGVYGVNDSGAELPTLWARLDYIREGTSPGDNAKEPTPSLYDKLVGQERHTCSRQSARLRRSCCDVRRERRGVDGGRTGGGASAHGC